MPKIVMKNHLGEVTSVSRTRDGHTVNLVVVPPLRAGQPWTPEEDDKLAWRFEKGLSMEDLALVHQRSRGAIRSELKRLGLIPGSLPLKVRGA